MIGRFLRRLDVRLARLSRGKVLAWALLVAVVVGVVDHFLKPELLVLYLVPLALAAWYGGRSAGLLVALYAAASAFVTQAIAEGAMRSFDWVSVVNLALRLATYVVIAIVMDRLRESRRQQQDLTGFIVHDLRSPISSSITGLLTLQQSSAVLSEADREMVDLALVSNQRALTLVNSILDVARLESDKMEVEAKDSSIAEVVQSAFDGLALWAKGRHIELASDIRVERMFLDPHLTERVLTNLLSNALKFSPDESQIVVAVEPDPHGVRFSVIDAGPGIPHDAAAAIFDPFVQVKGTQGGTGLGLTFCRLAVRAQGGRIGVHSKLGEGSVFWFVLPRHTPH